MGSASDSSSSTAGIVKGQIGDHRVVTAPVRQGQRHPGALSRCGHGHHLAPVGPGDALADGEPQPQSVGRRVPPLGVQTSVKEGGQQLL